MKIFDAHCHNFVSTPGLCGAVVDATNESDWNRVLAQRTDNIYAAIGVHPWFVGGTEPDWNTRLYKKLLDNPNVMVGEIGLDALHPNISGQQDCFITQLRIAHELGRIACIHCVHAWDKMLHILKHYPHSKALLFHGFSGNPEIVSQIGGGAYYSYGESVLNNTKIAAAIAATPNSQILVESDDASPTILPDVIRRISEIKHIPFEEMSDIVFKNAQRMLKPWIDCTVLDC